MNEKYWYAHVDHVIEGGEKTVLELFLGMRNKARPRGRGFFPLSEHSNLLELDNVDRLRQSLAGGIEEQVSSEKEGSVMDDNSDLTKIDQMIDKIITRTRGMSWRLDKQLTGLGDLPKDVAREKKLFTLGMNFIQAVDFCDLPLAEIFMEEGFNPNFQHPTKKLTALHLSAGRTAIEFSDMLMDSGKCDYLLKDSRGYLAYDLAYRFGKCSEITYELKRKTLEQAKESGMDIELPSLLK